MLTISYKIDDKPYIGIVDKSGTITHYDRFMVNHKQYQDNTIYIFMSNDDLTDMAEVDSIKFDFSKEIKDEDLIVIGNNLINNFKLTTTFQ